MIQQTSQKNIKYGQKSAQITLCSAHKHHVNVLPNSGNQVTIYWLPTWCTNYYLFI